MRFSLYLLDIPIPTIHYDHTIPTCLKYYAEIIPPFYIPNILVISVRYLMKSFKLFVLRSDDCFRYSGAHAYVISVVQYNIILYKDLVVKVIRAS